MRRAAQPAGRDGLDSGGRPAGARPAQPLADRRGAGFGRLPAARLPGAGVAGLRTLVAHPLGLIAWRSQRMRTNFWKQWQLGLTSLAPTREVYVTSARYSAPCESTA